jgi:DNA polymerase III gamma/tau subunit
MIENFKERVSRMKDKVLYEPDSPFTDLKLYPDRIRYALKYKGAQLDRDDIGALIEAGYEDEAFYLLMKALKDNPTAHYELIDSYTDEATNRPSSNSGVEASLKKALGFIDKETQVKGTKLAQWSRQGQGNWQSMYKQVADQIPTKTTPVLVANSTLIGLQAFISDPSKPVLVIEPDWIGDKSNNACGYQIDSRAAAQINKDFPRPVDYIVIDDTEKTGRHLQEVANFWHKKPTSIDDLNYLTLLQIPEDAVI